MNDEDRSSRDVKIGILKHYLAGVIYTLGMVFVGSCKEQILSLYYGWVLWKPHNQVVKRWSVAETSVLPIKDLGSCNICEKREFRKAENKPSLFEEHNPTNSSLRNKFS